MPTKGRDIIVQEKRGRSPLFPRKVEIGQQTRSPISPTLEGKNALASTESRKLRIYDKPTVCSTLYALNTVKHPFVDNSKFVPQSKVMSIRSMFNEKKVTNSYNNNTTGSTKTKDARKPLFVHGKKLTLRQPIENKNIVVDKTLMLFKDDHKNVIHEEDDKTIVLVNPNDILTACKVEFESISSNDHQHMDDDHDSETSQRYQPDKISDHGSDGHQSRFEVDQEFDDKQEVEHQEMEAEALGTEPDMKEGGEQLVPKEEDPVVKSQEVVTNGKKDTAAYDYVMEVTLFELRQQRLNRVKALVGAFENVISLECDTLQKSIKQQ